MSSSRVISLSTGTILRTVGVLLGLVVLWFIRDIILYVFSAMLLAGVLYPMAEWATKYRIPKGLTVGLFYLLLFGLILLSFGLLIPAVLSDAKDLTAAYGQTFGGIRESLGHLKEFSQRVGLGGNFETGLAGLQQQLSGLVSNAFAAITDIFGSLAGVVVVLVLSLYLIMEETSIRQVVKALIPTPYQAFAADVTTQIMQKLGSWLRGQLVLGLIIGVLYFLGLSVIGVPYALLLALMAGLLEFIPYVGPILSAVPAVLIALSISPARALLAFIVVVVVQQAEGHFIVPKVMQKTVGINPIISIVAFLIGAKLFGIVGAIFSIPLATAAMVFLQEFFKFQSQYNAATLLTKEEVTSSTSSSSASDILT